MAHSPAQPHTAPQTPASAGAARATAKGGAARSRHGNTGLLLIALEKIGRGGLSLALGLVALHLIHRNLGDELLNAVLWLHLDPDGAWISKLMDRADLVNSHQLRRAGLISILYAVVTVTEGVGLLMHKTWIRMAPGSAS